MRDKGAYLVRCLDCFGTRCLWTPKMFQFFSTFCIELWAARTFYGTHQRRNPSNLSCWNEISYSTCSSLPQAHCTPFVPKWIPDDAKTFSKTTVKNIHLGTGRANSGCVPGLIGEPVRNWSNFISGWKKAGICSMGGATEGPWGPRIAKKEWLK